jgi:2-keto-4-pentenoate hydratase
MSAEQVKRGLSAQLEGWRERVDAGERRVGWKIGLNVPAVQEALGIDRPVIGCMTDGTLLEDGGEYRMADGKAVGVEAEIAIHMQRNVSGPVDEDEAAMAVGGLGAAMEIVDIDLPFEDAERILAENVFHRGVLLGEPIEPPPVELGRAHVLRDGTVEQGAETAAALADVPETVALVADYLSEHGEQLVVGDVIISGALAPILFVKAGDHVEVDLGPLGTLSVTFAV